MSSSSAGRTLRTHVLLWVLRHILCNYRVPCSVYSNKAVPINSDFQSECTRGKSKSISGLILDKTLFRLEKDTRTAMIVASSPTTQASQPSVDGTFKETRFYLEHNRGSFRPHKGASTNWSLGFGAFTLDLHHHKFEHAAPQAPGVPVQIKLVS